MCGLFSFFFFLIISKNANLYNTKQEWSPLDQKTGMCYRMFYIYFVFPFIIPVKMLTYSTPGTHKVLETRKACTCYPLFCVTRVFWFFVLFFFFSCISPLNSIEPSTPESRWHESRWHEFIMSRCITDNWMQLFSGTMMDKWKSSMLVVPMKGKTFTLKRVKRYWFWMSPKVASD